jgi:hypothetical protein
MTSKRKDRVASSVQTWTAGALGLIFQPIEELAVGCDPQRAMPAASVPECGSDEIKHHGCQSLKARCPAPQASGQQPSTPCSHAHAVRRREQSARQLISSTLPRRTERQMGLTGYSATTLQGEMHFCWFTPVKLRQCL